MFKDYLIITAVLGLLAILVIWQAGFMALNIYYQWTRGKVTILGANGTLLWPLRLLRRLRGRNKPQPTTTTAAHKGIWPPVLKVAFEQAEGDEPHGFIRLEISGVQDSENGTWIQRAGPFFSQNSVEENIQRWIRRPPPLTKVDMNSVKTVWGAVKYLPKRSTPEQEQIEFKAAMRQAVELMMKLSSRRN